jgi:hypothetical protein
MLLRVLGSGHQASVEKRGKEEVARQRCEVCGAADSTPRPMPFKSKAQRRKFAQLLVEGKITDETFEEWNRETGSKSLPERVSKKKPVRKKKAVKKKARSKPWAGSAAYNPSIPA